MKDYDNSLITQIAAEEGIIFWWVILYGDDDVAFYFSSLDIDIVIDGETYIPFEFAIKPMNYSGDMSVDKIKIDFTNVHLSLSGILLNNNIQGKECIVGFGTFDEGTIRTEEFYRGISNEWDLKEKVAWIEVVSEFVYWNKKTLRKPGALCPWIFKGTECGYTGSADECNKTAERCDVLANSDNTGGFKHFPSIEEKEIYWGRKPV